MKIGYGLILITTLFALCTLGTASANTDNRHWTFASGAELTAILESYCPTQGVVTLKLGDDGGKKEFQFKDFSTVDKAWLTEWAQIADELEDVLKISKGTFEHYQSQGQYTTDFYVYYPGAFTKNSRLPMFLMFHHSGKGARYNKQFIEAAEAVGVIIVTFDTFRNSTDDKINAELSARFRELLPRIEQLIPHDPAKVFMGGVSGGAMTAYCFSASVQRPWAGIFANGGWLGGPAYFDKPYPPGMRIAMVNGNNDRAANSWVNADKRVLTQKGSVVKVFSFQGGHQDAPPMTQMKAFLWLLSTEPDKETTESPTDPVN